MPEANTCDYLVGMVIPIAWQQATEVVFCVIHLYRGKSKERQGSGGYHRSGLRSLSLLLGWRKLVDYLE